MCFALELKQWEKDLIMLPKALELIETWRVISGGLKWENEKRENIKVKIYILLTVNKLHENQQLICPTNDFILAA